MKHGVHLDKRGQFQFERVAHFLHEFVWSTRFNGVGAYLLVGGLGGLGRSISTWMVERGAHHLICLSRIAGTNKKHHKFAQDLASMGCRADFVQGSVSNLVDVTKAITHAQGRLKVILQMSMVLCNQSFIRMTMKEWNTAVDPKVKGTWNLHTASVSANADLDFFVLFSSLSGVIGQPGQMNYAGANTFLDAFSQYRSSLGLPPCAIEIGAVMEVGYLAEHESIRQKLKATGSSLGTVSERGLLEAMEAAVTLTSGKSRPTASNNFCLGIPSMASFSNAGNRSLWEKDVRMAVFHNSEETEIMPGSASSDGLKSFIAMAKRDAALLGQSDSVQFLAVEIGKKVFTFLLKPEEDLLTSCSLSDLGMNSLVAIEMRQWWKLAFGFDTSVLEMMGMRTIDALGEHAANGMLKLFHGGEGQPS